MAKSAEVVTEGDTKEAPDFIKSQIAKAKRGGRRKPLTEDEVRKIAEENHLDPESLVANSPAAMAAGPDPVGVEEIFDEPSEEKKAVEPTPMRREHPVPDDPATLEDFLGLGEEVGRMLADKNRKYGDSYARMAHVLPIFYPDGVPGDHLLDAVFILRIVDKLMRIAAAQKDDDEDPVKDIAGYAVLRMREMRNK